MLDHTRITIAAQALGIAQGALDVAKKYAHERQQFGKPIFDFQAVQFMLADMAMQIEAARQLTYAAAVKSERGETDLTFFSAASKCFATDVASPRLTVGCSVGVTPPEMQPPISNLPYLNPTLPKP